MDRLGDDVVGLIAALGHENAFVVAHDWGGGVAWNVALRHPERVRKLAVLDTPHPDVELVLPKSGEEKISWFRDAELLELGTGTHWVAQEEPERIAAELLAFFAR